MRMLSYILPIRKQLRLGLSKTVLAHLSIELAWPVMRPVCQQAEVIGQLIDLLVNRSRLVYGPTSLTNESIVDLFENSDIF